MSIPEETPRKYPDILHTPDYLGTRGKDYRNRTSWLLYLKRGVTCVEEPDGWSLTLTDPEMLINIATRYKSIFTFCPNNEMDLLLKPFRRVELYELERHRTFKRGKARISQFYPTRLDIRKGNKWTSIYNINLLTTEELSTQGLLREWLSRLDELQDLLSLQINLSSPSASATTILTQLSDKIYQEFRRVRDLSDDNLNLIYESIHNTWMEPSCIGQVREVEALDTIKAHLRALKLIPSIKRAKASQTEATRYNPDALMGFYKIEVNFPQGFNFGLLPFRGNHKSTSPHGLRICSLPKPYLDKLTEMKINFRVIRAIQYLPTGDLEYPFRAYARILEKIIDNYSDRLYPLDLKMLFYKTLIGSMQHFHLATEQPEDARQPDDFIWSTSALFNPAIASTVYGTVNVWVFEALHNSKTPLFRRHDGISREPEDYLPSPFRKETKGDIFIVNSQFYDKPGKTLLRDITLRERDNTDLLVVYPNRKTSKEHARFEPALIGLEKDFLYTIKPHPDKRIPTKPLKRVGELLENSLNTEGMPSMEDIKRLPKQKYSPEMLNKWSVPQCP